MSTPTVTAGTAPTFRVFGPNGIAPFQFSALIYRIRQFNGTTYVNITGENANGVIDPSGWGFNATVRFLGTGASNPAWVEGPLTVPANANTSGLNPGFGFGQYFVDVGFTSGYVFSTTFNVTPAPPAPSVSGGDGWGVIHGGGDGPPAFGAIAKNCAGWNNVARNCGGFAEVKKNC